MHLYNNKSVNRLYCYTLRIAVLIFHLAFCGPAFCQDPLDHHAPQPIKVLDEITFRRSLNVNNEPVAFDKRLSQLVFEITGDPSSSWLVLGCETGKLVKKMAVNVPAIGLYIHNENEGIFVNHTHTFRRQGLWLVDYGDVRFTDWETELYGVDIAWLRSLSQYVVIHQHPAGDNDMTPGVFDLALMSVKDGVAVLDFIGKTEISQGTSPLILLDATINSCVSNPNYFFVAFYNSSFHIFNGSEISGIEADKNALVSGIRLELYKWASTPIPQTSGYFEADILTSGEMLLLVNDGLLNKDFSKEIEYLSQSVLVINLSDKKIVSSTETIKRFDFPEGTDSRRQRCVFRCLSGYDFNKREEFLLVDANSVDCCRLIDGEVVCLKSTPIGPISDFRYAGEKMGYFVEEDAEGLVTVKLLDLEQFFLPNK